ncbi:DUF29 domain-containing protein [Imhoffiella purpurea]|uniref:DUF29 domain-containing protein n=1 Tax=Imhoffiella purpurea TaxID=1249627 RepID=W9VSR3_9GAMM|nr:DUF29 domain-containing protein [Imhoffiella purpurea]EXJ13400.1 hypothetical protein D779_3796 [Imhoffiella purpurea]
MTTSYEQDFFTWTQEQSAFLKQGRFDLLDLEHLAEEVADMGKSEQRELAHRLAVLIGHLLKLQIQRDRTRTNEKSWRNTVKIQRKSLSRHLDQNPGLQNPAQMTKALESAWDDGLDLAIRETGLDPDLFPEDNPYSLEQLLDPESWPPAPADLSP